MINAFIAGTPKAQPRVKATMRGRHAGVYTPKAADKWKAAVKLGLSEHHGKAVAGAYSVELRFVMPRPKSHYRSGKFSDQLKMSAPGPYHSSRPDTDNLAKAVLDAVTDCQAAFLDDCQVVELLAIKTYADQPEDAGVYILLTELTTYPEFSKST